MRLCNKNWDTFHFLFTQRFSKSLKFSSIPDPSSSSFEASQRIVRYPSKRIASLTSRWLRQLRPSLFVLGAGAPAAPTTSTTTLPRSASSTTSIDGPGRTPLLLRTHPLKASRSHSSQTPTAAAAAGRPDKSCI